MWNLEGMVVSGNYMDEYPVRGRVELSRVKFGGGVCHIIELIDPIKLFGTIRDRIILDHEQIERVSDN